MGIDVDLLRRHIADGIICEQQHPALPLTILNYSRRCQYEKLWDDVTLQCRGLVMCGEQVVARPFRKFFNDTEHGPGEIPWHLPHEVTEKLDGSLLIAFCFDGSWSTATRGSFSSQQAIRGGQMLQRLDVLADQLDPSITYLWEVIYPENRVVVDYGDRRECVLLAMIETATGREAPLDDAPRGLSVVRRLPPDSDAQSLRQIIRDDEEGYVVRFENGFRMKVKGQRYMQLHRLICGISSRSIWEHLSTETSLEELLAVIPDEFGDWVRQERQDQLAAFDEVMARVEQACLAVKDLPDRKSQALCITSEFRDVAKAAFAALDGKPTSEIIWKMLFPEFRLPEVTTRIEE